MRWLLPVAFAAPRCVPGASEQLCRYSPETVEWLREVAEEKLSDATAKRCVEPLAKAIRRTETYNYELCSFQLVSQEEGQAFTVFLPSDDQDKIAECDLLPWLMRFATELPGLAIDVGAGDSGSCSWPLLSEGHVVHMFEPGYEHLPERDFVSQTVQVNGWQERARLHGAVGDNEYVKELFARVSKIHLLKIDVDDRPSYEDVFAGVEPILHKTEIVQIEMIKEEIGRRGMHWVIETFWSHDFEMFGLEDVGTFPKYQHDSLGKRCKKGDMPSRMHSKAVLNGSVEYVYGLDGPRHIRMFPMCRCESKVCGHGLGSKDPLACNAQFAFVRRGTETLRRVARAFGGCGHVEL